MVLIVQRTSKIERERPAAASNRGLAGHDWEWEPLSSLWKNRFKTWALLAGCRFKPAEQVIMKQKMYKLIQNAPHYSHSKTETWQAAALTPIGLPPLVLDWHDPKFHFVQSFSNAFLASHQLRWWWNPANQK
jgi:hypothetical protein